MHIQVVGKVPSSDNINGNGMLKVGMALEAHWKTDCFQATATPLTKCRDNPHNITEMIAFHVWVKKK